MCTRILWNTTDVAVLAARTMDWPDSTAPVLTVLPRGMERRGGEVAGTSVVGEVGAMWTSRYGSVVTTMYGVGTADGVNEHGLAAHLLYLADTNFGDRDESRPGVHAGLWPQYLLDNAATVTEALALMAGVQVVMMEAEGHKATVHLALEDATGDSAIIEYLDGERFIHHDRDHIVLTNEPPYAEQRRLLAEQDFSAPSDTTPLAGNVDPVARFQRAAYFTGLLPPPSSERQAVAGVLAVARNVSIPFGAPYEGFGLYNTEYRTVVDLTNRRYFFELSTSPNVVWIDLDNLDFAPGRPTLLLDPDDIILSGEISASLTPGPAPF
ncbi:linear amide C-N hydrolase [Nocardioides sp. zg-1308]|uniref:Linear amide C-N hydrolase n=1 Tax=Nocardioides renjunii TaxID=3095075 RepID=A0ABU5KCJ0_9ACTN|nr:MULTISPECIES: linear amide C-N hydrolase [unclassified Nocardioides]MDZ5662285.1 linear amide C-N hydrolase [Nocardioides sp. S-58]NPD06017.1 linear amide C-N hydrolase [Nocardioides sp. zg-1308]